MRELLARLRLATGLYRCWTCHRWMIIHSMRELARCENAPLAIELTDVGLDAAEHERAEATGKPLEQAG